ncbi:hypothetical protein EYF80_056885 [Liparis tanakae]|uniref:Uncharacterized protein n=1 Tax=Liparis tanakae TaxID=230148 RepID=A0A4Z2EX75_9TELE|nr:hypothetical protein EYF80_056885 [Liparis tanakae]
MLSHREENNGTDGADRCWHLDRQLSFMPHRRLGIMERVRGEAPGGRPRLPWSSGERRGVGLRRVKRSSWNNSVTVELAV